MTRVLVVEDEESYSDPLAYMLRKEGYQVESIAIIESMDWQTQTIHFRSQEEKPLLSTNLQAI